MPKPNMLETRRKATLADVRWGSVLGRDRRADGTFFYSVKTTGVYCRPSCGARTPLPENVAFHGSRNEAEKAGFRPCKRCKPEQASAEDLQRAKVAEACRAIEKAYREPNLQQLAAAARMSASHFHRVFRSVVGLTPKQYAAAHRSNSMQASLSRSGTVTEAIYQAGFQSNGRFYANSNQSLGMTPTAFRRGGADIEVCFAVGECKLGSVLVAQSERGVCAILFGDDAQQLVQDLQRRFPRAELKPGEGSFDQLVAQVVGLVEASETVHNLPLDIRGTAFQRRVWQALQAIPYGSTATYQEIANMIGMPKAVRAVAQACAANGLAVAIPCHRVIRSDRGLSGYRWGIERKRFLLEKELKDRSILR